MGHGVIGHSSRHLIKSCSEIIEETSYRAMLKNYYSALEIKAVSNMPSALSTLTFKICLFLISSDFFIPH